MLSRNIELEIKDVLKSYDLGELVGYQVNERGYVNVGYAIEVSKEGKRTSYFLRRYKKGINEEEIQFEHAVIDHLISGGFRLVARVLKTKDGHTYLLRYHGEDRLSYYYAVFDFLSGEDRYTWVDPHCTLPELRSAARVLAQFHRATAGFSPPGRRSELKIRDLLPLIAEKTRYFGQQKGFSDFDLCLREHQDLVLACVQETMEDLANEKVENLSQQVIHCDFHPGNLKFSGDRVVGLFDFDWSKIDLRIFDVGLAVFYFFTQWGVKDDGALRLDDVSAFLKEYQKTLDSEIVPSLNPIEREILPYMILAGGLYVYYWTIEDYFNKDVDEVEYLTYLRHCVNLMKWLKLETNWSALRDAITKRRNH